MEGIDRDLLKVRKKYVEQAKVDATERLREIKSKTGKRKAGSANPKRQKGDSLELTMELFESGKSIPEIALERGLAESTIKSHLAEGIAFGRIDLEDCLPHDVILEILSSSEKFKGIKELRDHFKGKYDYGTLKMVFAGTKNT